jgi:hypothetical protein
VADIRHLSVGSPIGHRSQLGWAGACSDRVMPVPRQDIWAAARAIAVHMCMAPWLTELDALLARAGATEVGHP